MNRVEQIAPFPYTNMKKMLAQFPNAEMIWAQEEHRNQGAWNYMKSRFGAVTHFFFTLLKPKLVDERCR